MRQLIEIALIEPQLTAVIRKKTTFKKLSHIIPYLLDEVYESLQTSHITDFGHNLCLYRDMKINIEVGVQIFKKFKGKGNVICSELPGGRVVQSVHKGPYDKLVQTHSIMQEWCKSNNEILEGPCWEIYGDWNDDASELKTDVYYLLKSSKKNKG